MRLLAGLCVGVVAATAVVLLAGRAGPAGHPSGRARARWPRRDWSEWLQQAGAGLTPMQFWAGSALVGSVTFLVVVLVTRTPLVALAPALGVASVPYASFARQRQIRRRAWQAAWPDALRELIAGIVAGRSLAQAVAALGESGPEPLREAFADFPGLSRVFGTTAALEQVKQRLADPTSDRVIEVLVVAHERGGPIVRDVLEDLVAATTKDLKVLDEIDTDGLEMRINGRAVLVLPWMVLVALTLRPGPFRDFYRSSAGLLVVGAAAVLSAAGAAWLSRLARQPEEPRVFGCVRPGAPA